MSPRSSSNVVFDAAALRNATLSAISASSAFLFSEYFFCQRFTRSLFAERYAFQYSGVPAGTPNLFIAGRSPSALRVSPTFSTSSCFQFLSFQKGIQTRVSYGPYFSSASSCKTGFTAPPGRTTSLEALHCFRSPTGSMIRSPRSTSDAGRYTVRGIARPLSSKGTLPKVSVSISDS